MIFLNFGGSVLFYISSCILTHRMKQFGKLKNFVVASTNSLKERHMLNMFPAIFTWFPTYLKMMKTWRI